MWNSTVSKTNTGQWRLKCNDLVYICANSVLVDGTYNWENQKIFENGEWKLYCPSLSGWRQPQVLQFRLKSWERKFHYPKVCILDRDATVISLKMQLWLACHWKWLCGCSATHSISSNLSFTSFRHNIQVYYSFSLGTESGDACKETTLGEPCSGCHDLPFWWMYYLVSIFLMGNGLLMNMKHSQVSIFRLQLAHQPMSVHHTNLVAAINWKLNTRTKASTPMHRKTDSQNKQLTFVATLCIWLSIVLQ